MISAETSSVEYAGNASTSTPYSIPFRFDDSSWLDVAVIDPDTGLTALTEGDDYTVGGDGSAGTGTITTTAAVANDATLRIRRDSPISQTVDYENATTFPSATHERQMDRLAMQIQDVSREAADNLSRSLRVPDGETAVTLSASSDRAGKLVYFNATTGAVEEKTPSQIFALSSGAPADGMGLPSGGSATQYLQGAGDGTGEWATLNAAAISDSEAFGQSMLQQATAPAARELLGLSVPLENPACLARVHAALQALDDPSPGTVFGITGFGDSMAETSYTFGHIARELQDRYGVGAVLSPNLGAAWNDTTHWVYTGGAALVAADYDRFPGANEINIPAGGSAEIVFNPTAEQIYPSATLTDAKLPGATNYLNLPKGVRQISVFYMKETGAGTLDITVAQTGYSDLTSTIDCNAAEALARADFTPGNRFGQSTVTLEATTAAVRIVGVAWWGESGVLWLDSCVGGSTMTAQAAALDSGAFKTPYSDLLDELGIKLVLHAQRVPGDASWQANYEAFFAAYEALDLPQIVFAEPPRAAEMSPTTAAINTWLRAECEDRGIGFFDQSLLVTADLCTELGWFTDTVHLDPPAHRYLAGMFLGAVDQFRRAREGVAWSRRQLSAERARFFALCEMRTHRIFGRNGITSETADTDGGHTASVDSQKGFIFASATALGHAAARIGSVPCAATLDLDDQDWIIAGNGYRNVNLPSGVTAFLAFGGSATTITTLDSLAQKVFGIELALGSDVGSPGGVTTEVVRLFACDGTTTVTSAWTPCLQPGESAASLTGWGFVLHWDHAGETLYLYDSQNNGDFITHRGVGRLSLDVSDLLAEAASSGPWIHAGIVAEDSGNTPATTGEISWLNLSIQWGDLAPPFAVTD